jgi:hypothetical protein
MCGVDANAAIGVEDSDSTNAGYVRRLSRKASWNADNVNGPSMELRRGASIDVTGDAVRNGRDGAAAGRGG